MVNGPNVKNVDKKPLIQWNEPRHLNANIGGKSINHGTHICTASSLICIYEHMDDQCIRYIACWYVMWGEVKWSKVKCLLLLLSVHIDSVVHCRTFSWILDRDCHPLTSAPSSLRVWYNIYTRSAYPNTHRFCCEMQMGKADLNVNGNGVDGATSTHIEAIRTELCVESIAIRIYGKILILFRQIKVFCLAPSYMWIISCCCSCSCACPLSKKSRFKHDQTVLKLHLHGPNAMENV